MHTTSFRRNRGSALITVLMVMFAMALLTASMLTYTGYERKFNERQKLVLRARNMAETVSDYAAGQLTTKLLRVRNLAPRQFTTGADALNLPPASILQTNFGSQATVQLYAGMGAQTTATNPTLITNTADPNYGLQVGYGIVNVVSSATITEPSVATITKYSQQNIKVSLVPLFQFAIFYNQDLEFGPGANMIISGPVQSNGNLCARDQTGYSNTVQFLSRVSCAGGFYANTAKLGNIYSEDGSADSGPGGTGPLYFQNPTGTVTNIYSGSIWRDQLYGQATESATTDSNFKSFASVTYGSNLRSGLSGATAIVLPGIDNSTPTSARIVIATPSTTDTPGQKQSEVSRNAGLFIIVNPTAQTRNGILPDASTVSMPAYSYRCWLNTVNLDGTYTITEVVLPGQPSYGANNGTQNTLPNAFTDKTTIGVNQVLRIPASGRAADAAVAANLTTASRTTGYYDTGTPAMGTGATGFQDAYFYDLRRANGSTGYPFSRSSSNPFTPRPIAKIDFDLTRFRMTVERSYLATTTSTAIYYPGESFSSPALANPYNASNLNWKYSVYNPSAVTATFGFGPTTQASPYTTFPTAVLNGETYNTKDPFMIYYTTVDGNGCPVPVSASSFFIGSGNPCPWFNGISVYIESVDAEVKPATSRADSGVRFWNGRGPLVSLPTSTSYPGITFATNDAAYIIGHFNADGTINSTTSSTSNPGGYSAVYPDSANEYVATLMADAITIMSQPIYTNSGSNYYQIAGWTDSLSANIRDSSGNYSTSWQTSNPSSGNTEDGINTSIVPANLPFLGTATADTGSAITYAGTGSAQTTKFLGNNSYPTEVSCNLLAGNVPTTSHQTSGGAHNFPRLLENWNGTGIYIRGSMLCMFPSVVATEPWSIRIYAAPGRYWGLNIALTTASYNAPLQPVALTIARSHYQELTQTQYNSVKSLITALTN